MNCPTLRAVTRLTQRLSLLHRAIFWFSPLAWWLDRHLADLAEQASDEATLVLRNRQQTLRQHPAGFLRALPRLPGIVWWQGVSMARQDRPKKEWNEFSLGKDLSLCVLRNHRLRVVALAIPVVYLAASAHPAQHVAHASDPPCADQTPPAQQPSAPKSQLAATPAPAARRRRSRTRSCLRCYEPTRPAPTGGLVSAGELSALPRAPSPAVVQRQIAGAPGYAPVAPIALIAPIAPIGQNHSAQFGIVLRGVCYRYGYDDDQRFVIVTGKTDSLTMSGSTADARHVEKLGKSISGDFIWFQRDEKPYVIRDQATVDRARKLWAPQEELGKKQEALGKQQEALGKQQEELGARMEKVRVNVPDMMANFEKLSN